MLCLFFGCIEPRPDLTQETIVGKLIPQETLALIKEGVTTKDEVMALLGGPSTASLSSDGKEIWIYNYSKYRVPVTRKFGAAMNIETEMQITQVLMTKEGIVEKMSSTMSGKSETESKIIAEPPK
jgi:outer membrane protein assembly factor BamE (lipoprotein component of BamABCDE complex)